MPPDATVTPLFGTRALGDAPLVPPAPAPATFAHASDALTELMHLLGFSLADPAQGDMHPTIAKIGALLSRFDIRLLDPAP